MQTPERDQNERAGALFAAWEAEMQAAAAFGCAPSISRVSKAAGVSWGTAEKVLINVPAAQGRGRPIKVDDDMLAWLADAVRRGAATSTQEYCDLLMLELGVEI
eukprot:scaffold7420_cov229-Pinguiococcus_pyrenoidosus.AAC.4